MSAPGPGGAVHVLRAALPQSFAAPAEGERDAVPATADRIGSAESAGDPPRGADADRELLRRVTAADREAFRQLYLRYHARLSRFLFRVLRRHEDAEDVVNEAMLIVWQRAVAFRGDSLVSTWIFGIGYRCALKCIRRSAARTRAAAFEAEGRPLVTEDASRETEDRQILELGLARLPLEQRLVVALAYEMDCSCQEIAAIVGCPVNTVKTRMFHARRKLRAFVCGAGARTGVQAADSAAPGRRSGRLVAPRP